LVIIAYKIFIKIFNAKTFQPFRRCYPARGSFPAIK